MKDDDECKFEGELRQVVKDYKSQRKELAKARKVIEELKRENRLKTRECQEACKSLKDLQNELMRKSMHVGSLGMMNSVLYLLMLILLKLAEFCGCMLHFLELLCSLCHRGSGERKEQMVLFS